MDSSSAQIHHQDTLESMLQACPKPQHQQDKKPRPADEQALKCPRCDSTNTKFCYYNNYSLSQPRYFCKSCRRYWTKGGTLRNVPVGGGCRRNKRSSTSTSSSATSSSSSSSKRNQDHHQSMATVTIPSYDSNELSLAIARLQKQGQLGFPDDHEFPPMWGNPHHQMTDVLGSSGMFEALTTPQNGFHNLYYGIENGVGSGIGSQLEIGGIPYEGLNTVSGGVKQEMCNGAESRTLWGFPWQNGIGNDGNNNTGSEFDHQSRLGWNGIVGSSSSNWHGLLNSPLMSNIN